MKTINTYIIERLHITKNSKVNRGEKIDIPKIDIDLMEPTESIWKTLNIPDKLYLVYRDYYRMKNIHFSTMSDFLQNLILFQDDFENFNEDKDILYASNDLHEILDWLFNYLKITDRPTDENISEWGDDNESKCGNLCDDLEKLGEFYTNLDTDYIEYEKPFNTWQEDVKFELENVLNNY